MDEKTMRDRFCGMQRECTGLVNLNPIQRGGILTEAARKSLAEWGDGYSICDYCEGCLSEIKKPPVDVFVNEVLPEFLNMDSVRVTNGARESIYAVMHSVCEKGDSVLVDCNAHYTTFVAAERRGLKVNEVMNTGHPDYKIEVEHFSQEIEKTKPKLVVLTYPDGSYGNLPDAAKLGKICEEKNTPLLLNCAYSIGRMPVDGKKLKADFLVASGHKSMASSGPIGLLATTNEYKDMVFRKSERFKKKEIELLGCTSRGLPLVTMMASFPDVKKRVGNWGAEVENARHFVKEMEGIGGIKQLGEKPKNHDLISFETPKFYEISEKHKKGRFFLYNELKGRGIIGIKPGITKNMKVSTFGFKRDELKKVIDSFKDIAKSR